jgi:hypothetical protein
MAAQDLPQRSPGASGPLPHRPERGSDVEAWIRRAREASVDGSAREAWFTLDDLLDNYRLHADTGTPLGEEVQSPHSGR